MTRSFDRLARPYALLERLCFGRRLEFIRNRGVEFIDPSRPRKLLLLGDGDGRFALQVLKERPLATVHSVDKSAAMLNQASRRIRSLGPAAAQRYSQSHENALSHAFEENEYDVIVTQFFLDCFTRANANLLLSRLECSLKPEGRFIYADFCIPEKTPWNWLGRGLIRILYALFRLSTDIEASSLPRLDWPESLVLNKRIETLQGLVSCELRTRKPNESRSGALADAPAMTGLSF